MSEEEIRKMCSNIYEGEDWQPMKDYIKSLQNQLQQKENIIKEVREWVVKNSFSNGISSSIFFMPNAYANELLGILDKGE